jgi:hypothetical protein
MRSSINQFVGTSLQVQHRYFSFTVVCHPPWNSSGGKLFVSVLFFIAILRHPFPLHAQHPQFSTEPPSLAFSTEARDWSIRNGHWFY